MRQVHVTADRTGMPDNAARALGVLAGSPVDRGEFSVAAPLLDDRRWGGGGSGTHLEALS